MRRAVNACVRRGTALEEEAAELDRLLDEHGRANLGFTAEAPPMPLEAEAAAEAEAKRAAARAEKAEFDEWKKAKAAALAEAVEGALTESESDALAEVLADDPKP